MSRKSDVVRDVLENGCGEYTPVEAYPVTALASDQVALYVTEGDVRYLVFGQEDAVISILKQRNAYITRVESMQPERDPLFVGDPTFARAAHHMGES